MVGYLNVKSAGYRGLYINVWRINCRNKTVNLFIKEVDDLGEGFDAMSQYEVS
jgi:hypothetical protein